MNTKPVPLTAAERQKLYRQTHTMVGVEKRLTTSLDDIGKFFAKELNEPNVPRSMVLSRIILESHHRYCTPPVGQNDICPGAPDVSSLVPVSDIEEGKINEVAVGEPSDPQVVVTESVLEKVETPRISVMDSDQVGAGPQSVAVEMISLSSPVAFAGGKLWKDEGDKLVVKLYTNIDRREFLKKRGFACDYSGDKSWSKASSSSDLLLGLAAEVVAFMNATPADQTRILQQ